MTASKHVEIRKAGKAERKEQLLILLNADPKISQRNMMKSLGVKNNAVTEYMRELHAEGRLPEGALEKFMARRKTNLRRARRMREHRRRLKILLRPEKRREKLLKIMFEDPTLSVKALASKLGTSTRTVERHRAELRTEGFISGRAPKLLVNRTKIGARRELRMRMLLELVRANPAIPRKELVARMKISYSTLSMYIALLQQRRDLPEDYKLSSSAKKPQDTTPTKREIRRPRVLAGIAKDLSLKEIAGSLRVWPYTISRDIEAMRRSEDPELLEAEKEGEELRANTPLTDEELEMKKALNELGLTFDDVTQQYTDWKENAGQDDSLLRALKAQDRGVSSG